MDPEIKAEWIKRLSSGKYIQHQCGLRDFNKFCVLGVLVDMAVEAGIGTWERKKFSTFQFVSIDGKEVEHLGLAPAVLKYCKMPLGDSLEGVLPITKEMLPFRKGYANLAQLNDYDSWPQKHYSFTILASIIERDL